MPLRDGVLHDQLRLEGGSQCVAGVEAHEIGSGIVIVVLVEAQAELGGAGQVDVGIGIALQRCRVPIACCRGVGTLQR